MLCHPRLQLRRVDYMPPLGIRGVTIRFEMYLNNDRKRSFTERSIFEHKEAMVVK